MGRYVTASDVLLGTASILSLTAISLERMFAVKYPATHYNLSRTSVRCSIALAWIVGFVIAGVNLFAPSYKISTAIVFCLAFLLPLIVIIASYNVIFITAHNLKIADNRSKTLSRDIQIAKTISVIIGLFIVCWAPFFIVNMLYFFCQVCLYKLKWNLAISIVKAMHYSNSMMNFFVYAVRSPDFRATFKALIFKCNTREVRERVRSISFSAMRKKAPSFLIKKENNNDEDRNGKGRKSRLIFKNAEFSRVSCDMTDVSLVGTGSPSINFLVYDT